MNNLSEQWGVTKTNNGVTIKRVTAKIRGVKKGENVLKEKNIAKIRK